MPLTPIQEFVFLAFAMDEIDTADLRDDLLQQMRTVWTRVLTEEARRHGCDNPDVQPPSGDDLEALQTIAQTDAQKITQTYNNDLRREIIKIGKETPTANRNTYFARLTVWYEARMVWKSVQISLTTETKATDFTKRLFWERNSIKGMFRLTPTVATCDICLKLIARGNVSYAFMRKKLAPFHPNCIHSWIPSKPKQLGCSNLWTG